MAGRALTSAEAARWIAGAMFRAGLDDNDLCEAITAEAGILETLGPDDPRTAKHWRRIVKWLQELKGELGLDP